MSAPDYLIVAGFFVVMLGIGAFFAGRMRNLKDFFGGGQEVPWWVSGVSLYMTSFSAFAFVSYSALAYTDGFVAVTIWWLVAVCSVISARFFAARWRRAAVTTPLEYVEHRYGPGLRQALAWAGVPLIIIDDALKLFVIGTMVNEILDITAGGSLALTISACGLIMLAYTLLGGLWAVMITDFVQFVVMGVAVVVLAPLILIKIGGATVLIRDLPPELWSPTSPKYPWYWVLSFFTVMTFSYSVKWPLVQRYYSVRTDRDARLVGYMVAVLTFVTMPLILLPGFAARLLPEAIAPNSVYAEVCKQLLPVGMIGMVIAAMFSATMSTLSGDYNAVAAVLTKDLYARLFFGGGEPRAPVLAGRIATLIVGLLALGIALLLAQMPGEVELVKIMAELFSVLLPPVAIPMMFGLLTRRVSNAGALGGFLAGTVFGLTAYFMSFVGECSFLRTVPYLTWITVLPTIGVMLPLSYVLPDNERKREEIALFIQGLTGAHPPPFAAVSARGSRNAAALEIIGWASGAMGALLPLSILVTRTSPVPWLSVTVGSVLGLAGGAAVVAGRLLRGATRR